MFKIEVFLNSIKNGCKGCCSTLRVSLESVEACFHHARGNNTAWLHCLFLHSLLHICVLTVCFCLPPLPSLISIFLPHLFHSPFKSLLVVRSFRRSNNSLLQRQREILPSLFLKRGNPAKGNVSTVKYRKAFANFEEHSSY
jgi:hypothetical protein